ncbi:MAG: alpha/beta hydrolase [Sulfobacillus sp.]
MPVHADARRYLTGVALEPPWSELGIESARNRRAARTAAWTETPEPVSQTRDLSITGPVGRIALRMYIPEGASPFPVIVYLHGGGWVLGDLDQVDSVCRMLCNATKSIVISVDYHLSPEYRFPIAVNEAYRVLEWATQHVHAFGGDGTRLVVAGDSSGANLAIGTGLMATDRQGPRLKAMILAYPVCRPTFDTASYQAYGAGYGLTRKDMQWFWSQYLAHPGDAGNPYAVPLIRSQFTGLPPSLIITAEYDPLRDEGQELIDCLRRDGIVVQTLCVNGMIHGFFVSAWAPTHRRMAVDWVSSNLQPIVSM